MNNAPVTGPYTCGGTIGPNVSPQTQLSWKRSGSSIKFTLHAVQEELYIKGWDSCPIDDTAAWMSGVCPAHGTCSVAWQGSVRFTLKRKYKTYTRAA